MNICITKRLLDYGCVRKLTFNLIYVLILNFEEINIFFVIRLYAEHVDKQFLLLAAGQALTRPMNKEVG